MSRFPKISETFVLNEILEVERQGLRVDVHPLLRERQDVTHPEARRLVEEAHYLPFLSPAIVRSNLWFLRQGPRRYLGTLLLVLSGTLGSLGFFVGALGIWSKSVHMARQMQENGVEHVHCHFATHPAVAGLVIHRLTGIPFSFTAHGSDIHVDRRMLGTKVAHAAFVATISEYNRQVVLEECAEADHDRVHVVHCGVDLELFRVRPAPPPAPELRIVCIGTLHEVKGQDVLLDACVILRSRGVPIACQLVGDGPDRERLQRRVEQEGLGDAVRLAGAIDRHMVAEAIAASDVLVAPSVPTSSGRREGIPVVLMEAMAMGRPVVASRLSGIPELVEDGVSGLLAPPGDAVALADALQRLADDVELRDRLAAVGRRVVEEAFDLRRCAAAVVDLMDLGASR